MLLIPDLLKLAKIDRHVGEDVIDRLNFGTTVYLIAFFAILTGSKQHFGSPIQCLVSPEFPDSWVNYFHDFCYIQDKLKVKSMLFEAQANLKTTTQQNGNPDFDVDQNKLWEPVIVYYQWVPYLLFLQALFFLLPKLIWTLLGTYFCHGGELESVIEETGKFRGFHDSERTRSLKALATFILNTLEWRRNRWLFGKCAIAISYVLTKWIMVANVVGQFYVLSNFIGEGNYLWGWNLFMKIVSDQAGDPTSGIFPRVVQCVGKQAVMNGVHNITMQCVLMQNFINEKVFGFLYFWLVFVAVLTVLSAIRYSLMLIMPYYRNCVAEALLPTQDVLFSSATAGLGIQTNPCHERNLMDYFINNILRCDGVFLLSFIHNHAGGLVTHDLSHQLWLLAVQPPMKVDDGVVNVDPEFGEKTSSFQGMPWPYNMRRSSSGIKNHRRQEPADSWETQKPARLARSRSRSLSAGNLPSQRLPTAPSPQSSEIDPHDDNDSTLPLNSTLHPSAENSVPRRGIAFFDNRNRRKH